MVFYGLPMVFLWVSYGFAMVTLWVLYGFPVVLLWFSLWLPHGFPMDFIWFTMGLLWFPYGFARVAMVSLWFWYCFTYGSLNLLEWPWGVPVSRRRRCQRGARLETKGGIYSDIPVRGNSQKIRVGGLPRGIYNELGCTVRKDILIPKHGKIS